MNTPRNAFQNYGYGRPVDMDRQSEAANGFLWGVYRWMSLGLAVTAVTAWITANSSLMPMLLGSPMSFLLLGGVQLIMVFAFTPVAMRAPTHIAAAMFFGYAAVTGVTFSALLYTYSQAAIAQTFFVTAASFAALAFYGATTKRDLSGVGRFMFIGLIGMIIASVVNIFLASPAIYWVSTYAGVLIFAGLTAYETQKLKEMYAVHGDAGNLALRGALVLYLDFINLFLLLLRIFNDRE